MKKKILGIAAAIIVIVCLVSSAYVVRENEYKLVRQFGKVIYVVSDSGLHFKIPFIQSADTLPKDLLVYDLAASDVITKDKKTMITDSYVLWKITDPLKFAQSLNSSLANAESRLNTVVYNSTKNVISNMNQDEVITSRDGELMEAIIENVGDTMDQYGISLVSVETKKLDLPEDNKAAVYERMISERDNIAATYTAQGNSEAQVIRNTTDKDVAIKLSEAQKQAEILEAEGEAEYMKILQEAYSNESRTEFYAFVRSLDAAKASLTGSNKTLILSEDSPIAQIFYGE